MFQLEIVQLHKQFVFSANPIKINGILCILIPASRCFSLQVCVTSGQVFLPCFRTSPSEPYQEVPPPETSYWTANCPERAYSNLIGWSSCPCNSGCRLCVEASGETRVEKKKGAEKGWKKTGFWLFWNDCSNSIQFYQRKRLTTESDA